MRERLLRIVLLAMAIGNAVPGVWALGWPRDFYDSFPGGGRTWVAVDGPFNEHFVRDFGSLSLALAVVAVAALWRPGPTLVRVAGVASLTFGVPHFLYHLDHIDLLEGSDRAAELGALGFGLALAVAALVLARPQRQS